MSRGRNDNFWRRQLAVGLAGLSILLGGVAARAQYLPDRIPEGKEVAAPNPDIVEKPNAQLPLEDAEFTRSDGTKVKLVELFQHNRPVIVSLVYFSCPMLCGLTQDGLANAVRQGPRSLRLGQDYDIVVLSIDPDDTTELATAKRTKYLQLMERPTTQAGLTYLTGTQENIQKVADAVGYGYRRNFGPDVDLTSGKFAHSTGIFVCTSFGRLSQTILGLGYDPDTLHHALREAADGKIGSGFMETVALPCGAMRFNPLTGHYEHNPWFWAGTAGGLASLTFMTIFLGFMWRGELRKKRLDAAAAAGAIPAIHA